MRTSKRMIYYYFGSKEALYLAVLEKAYSDIRAAEASLPLEHPRSRGGLAAPCRADLRKRRRQRRLRATSLRSKTFTVGRHVRQNEIRFGRSTRAPSRRSRSILGSRTEPPECSETTSIRSMFIWRSAPLFLSSLQRIHIRKDIRNRPCRPDRRRKHKRMIVEAVLRLVRKE